MQVVGVDGCPGGWIAIAFDTEQRSLTARVHPAFQDLLAAYRESVSVGIDMLDAIVAAWTAHRHATGRSRRLPSEAATDSRGLRIEIVY